MAFFKFRSRGPQANEGRNAPAAVPAESVETLRRRARHRLIGAAVLVLLGVIGFPLLFDTQPRPVAVDIPIEIPDRNRVPPLPVPAPAPAPSPRVAAATPSAGGVITESSDGNEISPPATSAPVERPQAPAPKPEPAPEPPKPDTKPEPKPERPKPAEPKPEAKPEVKPEARPTPAKPQDDGARARALLEGKPPAAAAAAATAAASADKAGRFVVQVGAFAEADKAREVRQRLERSGLKTYTTVVKTADGERTRVRVGPYATRAEADQAAGKVKGLSLSASVLSL
ncbi:MAG: SPOR domain-containing protein [Variovorax sp.]|nr:MAG: SPOR domain-containing protein [Variovorax sp.]